MVLISHADRSAAWSWFILLFGVLPLPPNLGKGSVLHQIKSCAVLVDSVQDKSRDIRSSPSVGLVQQKICSRHSLTS